MDDLKNFIPSGANFGPFMGLAPEVKIALGIFLAAIALVALFKLFAGIAKFMTAGNNANKAAEAKSGAIRSGVVLAVIILIVPITSLIFAFFSAVQSA